MSSTRRPQLLRQIAEALTDVGVSLAPKGVTDILQSIAETARQAFGAAVCSVITLDPESDELVWRAVAGTGAEKATGMRMAVASGITGYVALSGEAVAVDNVAADARFAADTADSAGYVPRTLLAAPITDGSRILGVLSVLDREPHAGMAGQELELLSQFATTLAFVLPFDLELSNLGRSLLQAGADALDDKDLARAVRRAASSATDPTAEALVLAAQLASLRSLGEAERATASRLLDDFLEYAQRRRRR